MGPSHSSLAAASAHSRASAVPRAATLSASTCAKRRSRKSSATRTRKRLGMCSSVGKAGRETAAPRASPHVTSDARGRADGRKGRHRRRRALRQGSERGIVRDFPHAARAKRVAAMQGEGHPPASRPAEHHPACRASIPPVVPPLQGFALAAHLATHSPPPLRPPVSDRRGRCIIRLSGAIRRPGARPGPRAPRCASPPRPQTAVSLASLPHAVVLRRSWREAGVAVCGVFDAAARARAVAPLGLADALADGGASRRDGRARPLAAQRR